MALHRKLFLALLPLAIICGSFAQPDPSTKRTDPCKVIANQKWVAPSDLRACYQSFKVQANLKKNILDVITKSLDFHTSVNYQVQAPPPFDKDVHEDLIFDLTRIRTTHYDSDYDMHLDISGSIRRARDGHLAWVNFCYCLLTGAFSNVIPIPLVLLTEPSGKQSVYIAPEAFDVASVEFADQIDFWNQEAGGDLRSFSGAKVLLIDGNDPFTVVDAYTEKRGSFQGKGTRQNSFFASYWRGSSSWNYLMGGFASQSLPLSDQVTVFVQRAGEEKPENLTLSYRSRILATINPFMDGASYLQNNCQPVKGTNGFDINAPSTPTVGPTIVTQFQQLPSILRSEAQKHALNVIVDSPPLSDVVLPEPLTPSLPALSGSENVTQFYLLEDGKTGVLALGSFSDFVFAGQLQALFNGLQTLQSKGADRLIIDVTNNGGGFICVAHLLHRIIAGPKSTTVPNAGLPTDARDGSLARKITRAITANPAIDPRVVLIYNPVGKTNSDNVQFNATDDWLQPPVQKIINGRHDAFSQKLGLECFGFDKTNLGFDIPGVPLFNTSNIAIVSNGACASSCSLFSITMAKLEGTKTVVVGGKNDIPQEYCGTVGGQSSSYSVLDTNVKSTHLKNDPGAPPDLLVNGFMGITWRLGFGIDNPNEPEEWQDHRADLNLPLTKEIVNNPVKIWEEVSRRMFS